MNDQRQQMQPVRPSDRDQTLRTLRSARDMSETTSSGSFTLEIILVLIAGALTCVLYQMVGYKMIILNLYFLLVVLAGFFLGRYRAGVLALFCMVAVSAVTAFTLKDFAAFNSPIVIALAVTVWGAILGLTALLVGTLSDQRAEKIRELHDAYVGVVEVLATYLQSSNPALKSRSTRVAELSEQMARQMRLSPQHVDDIRVAALLHDMQNIEVTARVIHKAVGDMQGDGGATEQHTFHGSDLIHSLSPVLSRVFPLLSTLNSSLKQLDGLEGQSGASGRPLGSEILRVARDYELLREGEFGQPGLEPEDALNVLRHDTESHYDPVVLEALEQTVRQQQPEAEKTAPPVRSHQPV